MISHKFKHTLIKQHRNHIPKYLFTLDMLPSLIVILTQARVICKDVTLTEKMPP